METRILTDFPENTVELLMQDLTITLVQTSLAWEDAAANRLLLTDLLQTVPTATDLIVLPEMFSTGFSMKAETLAEEMEGTTVNWLRQMAEQQNAVITGSVIIHDRGRYYNRLLWVRPDGTMEHYDKRHLFRMAGETGVYSPGGQRLMVELKGWKICPLVCYDLRFPVWSRNHADGSYDLLLYVANWPEPRNQAWRCLLQARAIENLTYCAGVNRVGEDGNGVSYSGDSMIFDAKGQVLLHAARHEAHHTLTLSWAELQEFRKKFPAMLDADAFDIRVPEV